MIVLAPQPGGDEWQGLPAHDIIVMGVSAGGVEAFREIVASLPADLPASVFIVLHTPPESPSILPHLLSRRTDLSVAHAKNGELIQPGHIYVALPDYHLLLKSRHIELLRGPKEKRHRPAIDALFRGAAR